MSEKEISLPKDVSQLFSKQARWQSWLDVEAALAQAQAELGIIPAAAAQDIVRHADLKHLDVEALEADMKKTMAPVLSLVHALSHACTSEGSGFVHLGATTQNIIVAGRTLQMKKSHEFLLQRCSRILLRLADLAEEGAESVMAGRTNRKHALPITFGYKVASWIDEFIQVCERFKESEKRVFVLIFGGAIGAMHSFGKDGQQLVDVIAEKLGLNSALLHSRANVFAISEYLTQCGLLAVACERMAQELYTLMLQEIEEVRETLGEDVRGSSTMPHKDNPKHVVKVIALAKRLRHLTAPALELGIPSHEGDAATNQLMYHLIDEGCTLAYELVTEVDTLLKLIKTLPVNMLRNLSHTKEVIASENLMLLLVDGLGRQIAHDLVHSSIRKAFENQVGLVDILLEHPEVSTSFPREMLQRALDPAEYTGQSSQIARVFAKKARDVVNNQKLSLT